MNNRRFARSLFAFLVLLSPVGGVADAPPVHAGEIPLTLQAAIDRALSNRLLLRMATIDIENARRAIAEAKGAYRPQMNLEANVRRVENYDDFTGLEVVANVQGQDVPLRVDRIVPEYNVNGGLNLKLNLYSGGQISARVREAESELAAVQAQREIERRDIIIDVAISYWAVKKAHIRYLSVTEAVRLARSDAQLADREWDLGKISEIERDEIHLFLLEQQIEQTRAQTDLDDALRRYVVALGYDEKAAYHSSDVASRFLDDAGSIDISELVGLYRSAVNPELAQAHANLDAARARQNMVRSEHYPKFDLIGRYLESGRDNDTLSDAVSDLNRAEWSIGVELNWPFYNGSQTTNRVAQAEGEVRRSKLALGLKRINLEEEQKDKASEVALLKEQVRLATMQLEVSRRKERIAEQKAQTGRGTVFDYHRARIETNDVKTKLETIQIDWVTAQITYALMAGNDSLQEIHSLSRISGQAANLEKH